MLKTISTVNDLHVKADGGETGSFPVRNEATTLSTVLLTALAPFVIYLFLNNTLNITFLVLLWQA